MTESLSIRLAREDDIPTLEALIPLSVRILQAPFYSSAQVEAAFGPVFGVDRQLISDGTYFIVEQSGHVVFLVEPPSRGLRRIGESGEMLH
jgi:hypothetical protein